MASLRWLRTSRSVHGPTSHVRIRYQCNWWPERRRDNMSHCRYDTMRRTNAKNPFPSSITTYKAHFTFTTPAIQKYTVTSMSTRLWTSTFWYTKPRNQSRSSHSSKKEDQRQFVRALIDTEAQRSVVGKPQAMAYFKFMKQRLYSDPQD